jgi:putative redox protein
MSSAAEITWIGPGLRLVGETAHGQAVVIDHVLGDEERQETGPRPMELILIGVVGCTVMDVVSLLKKQRQPFTGVRVKATAERDDEHPKVYTKIHLEYIVTGEGVDVKAVERAIELSRDKYCPGLAMLGKSAEITHSCSCQLEEA